MWVPGQAVSYPAVFSIWAVRKHESRIEIVAVEVRVRVRV
jgi:hypothetical protein